MASLNELLTLIERDRLQAYHEVIEENNLVDTGLLRDSARVEIDDDFTIRLITQDYYTYLDEGTRYIEPYDLTQQIINHELFLRAEERIGEAIALEIENKLKG